MFGAVYFGQAYYGQGVGGELVEQPQFSGCAPIRLVMIAAAPLRVIEYVDADALVR